MKVSKNMLERSLLLRSQKSLKRGLLKKVGSRTKTWQAVRAKKALNDVNDEELIRCQDFMLGMERCGYSYQPSDIDLHHSKGRDGDLLTDTNNLVWLSKACHMKVHA